MCSAAFVASIPFTKFRAPPRICKRKSTCMVLEEYPRGTLSKVLIHRVHNSQDLRRAYTVWNRINYENLRHGEIDPNLDESNDHATSCVIATMLAGKTVGAGRIIRSGYNVRLDRVGVIPDARGKGVGKAIVQRLVKMAHSEGCVWVKARRADMGFWSLMGFEAQGNLKYENGGAYRTMVFQWPECAVRAGCVGLHHVMVQVRDIEKSLAFYGGLGFVVVEKFYEGGARTCFVEGFGCRLKLVESDEGTGAGRLVVDVTKACVDLGVYLEHLKHRNGGVLKVKRKPEITVQGGDVVTAATVTDPDGAEIGFFRRESVVPPELRTKVDW